ncbi:hypothetical protein C4D51_07375 [Clostridium perfringens]
MIDYFKNLISKPIIVDEETLEKILDVIEVQSKEPSEKTDTSKTIEALERGRELLNTKFDKVMRIAKENTKYNEQGYAVISKDDEWREDNEWNRDYDEKYGLDS